MRAPSMGHLSLCPQKKRKRNCRQNKLVESEKDSRRENVRDGLKPPSATVELKKLGPVGSEYGRGGKKKSTDVNTDLPRTRLVSRARGLFCFSIEISIIFSCRHPR